MRDTILVFHGTAGGAMGPDFEQKREAEIQSRRRRGATAHSSHAVALARQVEDASDTVHVIAFDADVTNVHPLNPRLTNSVPTWPVTRIVRLTSMSALALICCGALLPLFPGGGAGFAQERPLPEPEAFLNGVRARLQPDDARQSRYVYTYTERLVKVGGDGRPRGESLTVTESYPGFGSGEPRWERVLEKDGKRVPDAELLKKDAERRKKAEEYARRMQSETERGKILRERDRKLREIGEAIDDIFRVYTMTLQGRETVDGHETIAVSFTPNSGATALTRTGKQMRAFEGRVWISESDYEIVKLDLEAIRDLAILGVVARLHKGSKLSFENRNIDGEWLPSKAKFKVSARVLLLKRLREEETVEFSNYRKFSVDTVTTIAEPQPPH
jgi:hypothetical protein